MRKPLSKIAYCLTLFFAFAVAFVGCGGGGGTNASSGNGVLPLPPDPSTVSRAPVSGTLTLSADQQIAPFTLAAGDSSHTITGTNTPLDGIIIAAPGGGLSANQTVIVHYSTITSHTFGNLVSPKSPLISLELSGGSSVDGLMVILPITIPTSDIGGGLYYEASKQAVTPIPSLTGSKNVTMPITRFGVISRASRASGSSSSPGFFISSSPRSQLLGIADSGYRVGTNNAPFPNYRSAITSHGECAGIAALNMWCYDQQKSGTLNLGSSAKGIYTYLDSNSFGNPKNTTTPRFWQDDSKGFRLASALQPGILEQLFIASTYSKFFKGWNDAATFDNLVRGLAFTQRPQLLGLNDSTFGSGHVVVVYLITNNLVYINDPNFPYLDTMGTRLVKGSFQAYASVDYNDPSSIATTPYTHFILLAHDALISDDSVSAAWSSLSTAGDSSFPAYKLPAYDGTTKVSDDAPASTLAAPMNVTLSGTTLSLNPTGDVVLYIYKTFTEKSQPEAISADSNGMYNIPLQKGKNIVGCYMTDINSHFVDFRYLQVFVGLHISSAGTAYSNGPGFSIMDLRLIGNFDAAVGAPTSVFLNGLPCTNVQVTPTLITCNFPQQAVNYGDIPVYVQVQMADGTTLTSNTFITGFLL